MTSDEERRHRHRDLQLQIREVAYLLWEASGRDHRRTLDFWLAAEREVLSETFDATHQGSESGAEFAGKSLLTLSEGTENAPDEAASGPDSVSEG
ncbi:MAG: DUF2934 domain-containing protein [Defluviicoccus sp.]|nr:MAG: DUF2934 domain-containing protein [Defluviicoccus sp.]